MPDELKDAIVANATGPKRAQDDAGSVEQHTLPDQIEAARFVQGSEAAAKPHRGLRFTRLVPPGATS